MNFNSIDIYSASKKLRLRAETSTMSTFSTLWHSEVLVCHFNRSKGKIESVFCKQELSENDTLELQKIMCNFYNNNT
jgi:hypothetical protein